MKNLSTLRLLNLVLLIALIPLLSTCTKKDPPPKPVAYFTYYPNTNLIAPVTLSFTNKSENANSYLWTYGTGLTDTDKDIVLTASSGGTYTITLTVKGDGGTDTYSRTITVTNPTPPPSAQTTAGFTYSPSQNLVAPAKITFTNTSKNADSNKWDFGDGTTSTDVNPVKEFTKAGTYKVKLTATGKNNSNDFSADIIINNPTTVPTTGFTYSPSTNLVAPVTIAFTNTSTNATSYKWDFGDGTTSTTANPTKTFTNDGTYTVKLTATGTGGSSEVSKTLVVAKAATATGQVVFWTDKSSGWSSIDVTVGGTAAGSITGYSTTAPACGTSKVVTVTRSPGTYAFTAKSNTGVTWSGNITITANGCGTFKLSFPATASCDWITYSNATFLDITYKWGSCGTDGLSVKVVNKSNITLQIFLAMEGKNGKWDESAGSAKPGTYFSNWSCANTGQYKVWAMSNDEFNKNSCPYPKP